MYEILLILYVLVFEAQFLIRDIISVLDDSTEHIYPLKLFSKAH